MITNTKVVYALFILVLIDYALQLFHNQEIDVQILHNLYPTILLFGLSGIFLIDLQKGKLQEIIQINGWNYVTTNLAIWLSWFLHISMVTVPTYILYCTPHPKKNINPNYYRFLLPFIITIAYKFMIYPKNLSNVYALNFPF